MSDEPLMFKVPSDWVPPRSKWHPYESLEDKVQGLERDLEALRSLVEELTGKSVGDSDDEPLAESSPEPLPTLTFRDYLNTPAQEFGQGLDTAVMNGYYIFELEADLQKVFCVQIDTDDAIDEFIPGLSGWLESWTGNVTTYKNRRLASERILKSDGDVKALAPAFFRFNQKFLDKGGKRVALLEAFRLAAEEKKAGNEG